MSDDKKPIHVSFRSRPMNRNERRRETCVIRGGGRTDKGNDLVILDVNPNVNQLDPQACARDTGKTYACDRFFDDRNGTEEVYEATVRNLVPRLLDGKNGSAFCYGPTGTGKTFTMFGDEQNPGLVRLVGADLFDQLEVDPQIRRRFKISGLEIYGEDLRDLLSNDEKALKVVNTDYGTRIHGLSRHEIHDVTDFVYQVELCRSARVTESTNANAVSSRSHCIIQVLLEQVNQITNEKTISKLNLIDLAGSERATVTDGQGRMRSKTMDNIHLGQSSSCRDPRKKKKKKKKKKKLRRSTTTLSPGRKRLASKSSRSRLDECRGINSSLLALKKCIRCLVQNKTFIPWRDSKLTRLLEDTLQGDGSAYMIVCLSKGSAQWQATRDTLEYGSQARMIKVGASSRAKAKVNYKQKLQESRAQNQLLWTKNQQFEQRLAALEIILAQKDELILELRKEVDSFRNANAQLSFSVSDDKEEDTDYSIEDW